MDALPWYYYELRPAYNLNKPLENYLWVSIRVVSCQFSRKEFHSESVVKKFSRDPLRLHLDLNTLCERLPTLDLWADKYLVCLVMTTGPFTD